MRTTKPKAPLDFLDRDLASLAASLAPSSEERKRHAIALEAVKKVLQKEWPESKVHLFGSTANDLCIGANNDIDVCIELPRHQLDAEGGSKGAVVERMGEIFELKVENDRILSGSSDEDEFINLHVISSARVPVVKACHGPTGNQGLHSRLASCLVHAVISLCPKP